MDDRQQQLVIHRQWWQWVLDLILIIFGSSLIFLGIYVLISFFALKSEDEINLLIGLFVIIMGIYIISLGIWKMKYFVKARGWILFLLICSLISWVLLVLSVWIDIDFGRFHEMPIILSNLFFTPITIIYIQVIKHKIKKDLLIYRQ